MKGLQEDLVVIGLAAAIKLSAVVAGQVKDFVRYPKWLPILSFILVFILVVILVRWCANLIQAALKLAMLGWLNKIGGVVLYAILFTAVYSIFLSGTSAHILSSHAISSL
jgi:membrane protein required for colicin V production